MVGERDKENSPKAGVSGDALARMHQVPDGLPKAPDMHQNPYKVNPKMNPEEEKESN